MYIFPVNVKHWFDIFLVSLWYQSGAVEFRPSVPNPGNYYSRIHSYPLLEVYR